FILTSVGDRSFWPVLELCVDGRELTTAVEAAPGAKEGHSRVPRGEPRATAAAKILPVRGRTRRGHRGTGPPRSCSRADRARSPGQMCPTDRRRESAATGRNRRSSETAAGCGTTRHEPGLPVRELLRRCWPSRKPATAPDTRRRPAARRSRASGLPDWPAG